ncbi:MAG: DUF418 domain-containing protein [Rhodococcus sp. (in: high G+C Gram-positive bacteria)]|uniref:DUF418 domain-containing protein n=1 Tax=Rhodococcus sp. EPR-157 TaxID=1813677 RepID=UPI0007BC19D1|nr:DUF418 domain-containing protein [Rhodococcus sp. EPR-157]KZF05833.1 hypothetical protein A2J03_05115 [Rhodococcus sp. EPR-157]
MTTDARYRSLDVLRGIAILGTLGTNVWIFTSGSGLVGYLDTLGTAQGGWGTAERVLQQLAQGKFLGLLTIMFGVGLAIQQRSALRNNLRWPGRYPLRAGLLFVDGLLHFALFTEFDVLMGYAITGLVVAYVLATSERAQRRWMISASVVHVLLMTAVAAAMPTPAPGTSGASLSPNLYADGSFWELMVFRLDNALAFRAETILILPMSIALFLLGAKLFRAGVLGEEGADLRRRLVLVGLVAVPADFVVGMFGSSAGIIVSRYLLAPLVSLGILALVAQHYIGRSRVSVMTGRLSEIGRMALSCYVLQNVVASILCYGWGFGLAIRLDTGPLRVLGTISVYIVTVGCVSAFAHVWLRRYQRGPIEWLWNYSFERIPLRTS